MTKEESHLEADGQDDSLLVTVLEERPPTGTQKQSLVDESASDWSTGTELVSGCGPNWNTETGFGRLGLLPAGYQE